MWQCCSWLVLIMVCVKIEMILNTTFPQSPVLLPKTHQESAGFAYYLKRKFNCLGLWSPKPFPKPSPNYIDLLKQTILLDNRLLNRNKQGTSHKLYMRHSIVAGYLVLVSIIWLCLATFCA